MPSSLRNPLLSRLLWQCLPQCCLLCGESSQHAICKACAAGLPWLSAPAGPAHPACPVCAVPLGMAEVACGACLAHPPAFDATRAVWRYAFPLDRLVQLLKFGGRFAGHRFACADFLAQAMLAGECPGGDVIVPVPLSAARLRERGFNQALEMARPLARSLGLPLAAGLLTRVRETVPQSGLPWRVRHRNVRRAFACTGILEGKTVILIDDVMTTGATLNAAARALKDAGAARVVNWVAARALKDQATGVFAR